ncbi:MAG: Ig-like domain-containing protein [Gemmatimonadales bacterium]
MHSQFLRHLGVTLATLAAFGCGNEDLVLPSGPAPGDEAGDTSPSASRSTVSADPASIPAETGTSTIRVTVRDRAGAPLAGATVQLSASGSGNTVTQPAGPTGSDGVATGALQSTIPGTKDVTATVNGSTRIDQTAQVSVSLVPASRIELVEGDDQSAAPGTEVPVRPAVRVTDAQGQPVAGFEVTFLVTRGGGAVTGALQPTDVDGIARVESWTLGSPGPNTLEARAGSLSGSPVVFEATARPGISEPHHFVFLVQPRSVEEDEPFSIEVALVDASGHIVPLSGIEIYLGLFPEGSDVPSNNFLLGDRFRDTERGVAAFTLRVTREGPYRFRALSDELPALGPHGPEPYLFSNPFNVD